MKTVPTEGLLARLQAWIAAYPNAQVRLYQGTPSIGPDTVRADMMAAECDFSGYGPVNISASDWGTPTINSPKVETDLTAPATFTHSGGATNNFVAGYFVEDGATLLEVEPLSGGFWMDSAGKQVQVTLHEEYVEED